jgi:hypothetical protein
MAWSFNVFTGNLDQTGSSGAVVFEGEEETFDDLPVGIGDPPVGSSYLVRTSTGVWLVNRRQAGIWIRRNNTGVRATDWEYGGDYPVNSVNGQTGNVSLTASSVGAAAATHAATHAAAGSDPLTLDVLQVASVNGFGNVWGSGETLADVFSNAGNAFFSDQSDFAAASHTHAASDITSGVLDNARINFAAPPAIGNTTRNTGAFTTLSAAPTSGSALTLTGGTVTASAPVFDATQTWNASGTTFTGMRFVFTNTASDHRSLLLSFDDGATPSFGVQTLIGHPINQVVRVFGGTRGLLFSPRNTAAGGGSEFFALRWQLNQISMVHGTEFGWAQNPFQNSPDLSLHRDAADTLAQRRAANAQTFRLYSTFTSTTSFERLNLIAQSAGSVIIGTEKGSAGGTARGLELRTDNVARINISATGGIGFYGAAASAQPAAVADATDAASTQARLNDLLARLRTLGLIAT